MFEGTSLFTVDFFSRLAINVVSIYVIVWFCYYKRFPRRDFMFSFILFGLGVFLVTKVLHQVNLPMGFAFGLFALFSMLRYRTESISIKEMTYLFLVIGIALICAIAPLLYYELIAINLGVLVVAQLTEWLESRLFARGSKVSHLIRYDVIENIRPEKKAALFADLRQRTGHEIIDVQIEEIDFLRDSAMLRLTYSTVAGSKES